MKIRPRKALQSLFVLSVSLCLDFLFLNFLGVVAIRVVGVPMAGETNQDDCKNDDDNKDYITDELPDAFKNAVDEIKHRLPPQSIYRQKGNQCKTIFLKTCKKVKSLVQIRIKALCVKEGTLLKLGVFS